MAELSLIIFAAVIFVTLLAGILIGRKLVEARLKARLGQWKMEMEKGIRQDAVERSRVTLAGKFTEQIAPYFPDFPYDPTEARFIGTPVDFIVFKGVAEGEPKEVVFVEVKSGKSKLTGRQNKLKEVIERKKIKWEEYRVE